MSDERAIEPEALSYLVATTRGGVSVGRVLAMRTHVDEPGFRSLRQVASLPRGDEVAKAEPYSSSMPANCDVVGLQYSGGPRVHSS